MSNNRYDRKVQRRADAEARQAEFDKLSPMEKAVKSGNAKYLTTQAERVKFYQNF